METTSRKKGKKPFGMVQTKLKVFMEAGTECMRIYPAFDNHYVHKDSVRGTYRQAIKSTGYPLKVFTEYGDIYLARTDM
jgi:hypothetical protein